MAFFRLLESWHVVKSLTAPTQLFQDGDMKKLRNKLHEIESEINKVVSEMQKMETKNSKALDVFDKVKDCIFRRTNFFES